MTDETTASTDKAESSIDMAQILSTLWASRKFITYAVGIGTLLAIIVSLLLPNYFRSTAVILPETDKSRLGQLGGLSDIAALAGIGGAEGSLVKLYPTIIKSESVLKNVIYANYYSKKFKDSVNLIQFWDIDAKTPDLMYELALRSIRDQLDVTMETKTNVVSLSIDSKEAQVSADIVNRVAAELDGFIRTKRKTNASEQRKWIEARLAEVKSDLQRAENTLRDFREKNRRVNDSPELLLEQDRLAREVQINATLYMELKKQYELVKIEEIKNVPIINILDAGRAAARKESPRRTVIVVSTFLLSILGACGYILLMQRYGDLVRVYANRARESWSFGVRKAR